MTSTALLEYGINHRYIPSSSTDRSIEIYYSLSSNTKFQSLLLFDVDGCRGTWKNDCIEDAAKCDTNIVSPCVLSA